MGRSTFTSAQAVIQINEQRERKQLQSIRDDSVSKIQVTTSSGRTFDGDEESQNRMMRTLFRLQDDDSVQWILSDNTTVTVPKSELEEALQLASEQQNNLWVTPGSTT